MSNTASPRPRAQSEALPKLPSGRWRLVGAWSSFRRSLHATETAPAATPSGMTTGRRDSTLDIPRKRVSLFLKRRHCESFRRVQSGLPFIRANEIEESVCESETKDDNEGSERGDEIVGEICLEDFAEGDDEWSVDFDGLSRRGSVRVDGVLLEEEDVKKLLEMGIEDWFEDESGLEEFEVGEEVEQEWRRCGEEHNRVCGRWRVPQGDVRDMVPEWERRRAGGVGA